MKFSVELPFEKIVVYQSKRIDFVCEKELKHYLKEKTNKDIELKGGFFEENSNPDIAKRIAETRVRDKTDKKSKEPLPVEVDIEKKMLSGKKIIGILYDGVKLTGLMLRQLPDEEKNEHVIVITERLVGTIQKKNKRYHIRTVINSVPSIVSTSGIVEGPAKPREYYFEGEKSLDFTPMEYHDERMTEAVKSYALQTVFWRLTGEPFCKKEGCLLYNSHWQKEVIDYQTDGKLCGKHKGILEEYT